MISQSQNLRYEQDSTARLQARSHLGHHPEDEGLICKPGHPDKLEFNQ